MKVYSEGGKDSNITSLIILTGRTHRASLLMRLPDGPNLWKGHFVTRGKILDIGSILFINIRI